MNRPLAALCALAFLLALDVSAQPQEPPAVNLGETLQDLPEPLDPLLAAMSANDNFASATVVSSFPYFDSGDNSADTTQAGEPLACDGVTLGHTVWYRVTAAQTGSIQADTIGSSFDTVLGAYTGSSLAALVPVACNDDRGPGDTDSQITFPTFAGSTYYIQVGGYMTASGPFFIDIDNPGCAGNDNQANACIVPSLPYADAKATAGATTELGEPPALNCPANNPPLSHTVWYRYTVPGLSTVSLTASTAGSSYDTVLDVFVGQAGRALVHVACNDDTGDLTSQVSWSAVAGMTYYIRASGYDAHFGNLAFSLS